MEILLVHPEVEILLVHPEVEILLVHPEVEILLVHPEVESDYPSGVKYRSPEGVKCEDTLVCIQTAARRIYSPMCVKVHRNSVN